MDVSPYLSTLAPEILQLVIEHTHASAHWPLAQTCKHIYLKSESILERHRRACQEFRVASDLDPRTVINLLWSVFSQGAASIEAWHVREFEVWGNREGSNSDSWEAIWKSWQVDVDTGKRTVKRGIVPWPLSNQEINYFCEKMLKLPRFYGEHRNLNDELRQVFETRRDCFPKAILLAHLPRIQALRYAQVDDELTRHSLDALSGFIYWCESAGTWLPGLESLSKVALHIGLDRTDTEVVPPEYLCRSADNFCGLLCLPNVSEVYISHMDGGLPLRDRGRLCLKNIRPSLTNTSPVQTIILDMLEYELSDRLIDFIARIPQGLQALAIRFNTNNYNDLPENTERLVHELSKYQGKSLQRLCIHDDEQDERPSSLNWRTPDELIPFEDLRVANLDWREIEAGLDPTGQAQSRSELLERLVEVFKNTLPAKMEIVAFDQSERDEPVFFKLVHPYVNDLGEKSLSTWFPLAKDYIDLCESRDLEDGSLCIYSAWVWHILLDFIFSPSTKRWFGDDWTSFGRFHSKFKAHVDSIDNEFTLSFYAWRSESVRMLYTFNGDHVDPALVKKTLRDHLQPSFVARGADPGIIEEKLSDIVKLAILLDRQMLVSRWDYRIEMCDPSSEQNKKSGFPFTTDETVMMVDGSFQEIGPSEDGDRADFVSVPSLRVLGELAGGADGDPYTKFMRKRLVKYYHLSRLHIPIQVVTNQLSSVLLLRIC